MKVFLCTCVNRTPKESAGESYQHRAPTDDDERVVDVDAAEAVGGLADVRPRVLGLHLLDAQSVLQHPEAGPAAVDVAAVFGPHDERRGVALHRAGQLDGAAQAGALPVGHSLRHPGGT